MGILGDAVQQARQFQGLALEQNQLKQQQQLAERQRLGMEALNRYRETAQAGAPDENAMTVALINNPDAAKSVLAHVGIQDQRQKQDAASFALRASTIADNPEQFMQAIDSRIAYLQQAGRDPKDTIALREQYAAGDVAGAKQALKSISAALVGDGSLDKSAYEMTFGKAPESLSEWQKQQIALEKQKIALDERRLGAMQSGYGQLTADERNWNRYQDLLKTDPKQARQFGIAKGFVTNEGQKLSVFDSKVIDSASTEAATSSAAASRYLDLASKLREKNVSGGLFSTWAEAVKDISGNQDEITNLKRTVMEVVNSEAIKSLPPGTASNADVAFAREPFPTARANGEYVAKWLEAISRLNQKRAEFAEHKARFIGQYGGQRDPETGETVLSSWKRIQSEQAPADSNQLFKDADAIIGGQ